MLPRSAKRYVSMRLPNAGSSFGSQLKSPAKMAGSQFHLVHSCRSALKYFCVVLFSLGRLAAPRVAIDQVDWYEMSRAEGYG